MLLCRLGTHFPILKTVPKSQKHHQSNSGQVTLRTQLNSRKVAYTTHHPISGLKIFKSPMVTHPRAPMPVTSAWRANWLTIPTGEISRSWTMSPYKVSSSWIHLVQNKGVCLDGSKVDVFQVDGGHCRGDHDYQQEREVVRHAGLGGRKNAKTFRPDFSSLIWYGRSEVKYDSGTLGWGWLKDARDAQLSNLMRASLGQPTIFSLGQPTICTF